MVQRLEIRYKDTTSSSIGSSYLNGMKALYMERCGRMMGGDPLHPTSNLLYKFNGFVIENRVIRKTKNRLVTVKNAAPDIDVSRLVVLGGNFEQIGGRDEAVGGGTQKVGSVHK